jgi:hypothetical protein
MICISMLDLFLLVSQASGYPAEAVRGEPEDHHAQPVLARAA